MAKTSSCRSNVPLCREIHTVPSETKREPFFRWLSRKAANRIFDARGFSDRFVRRLAAETTNKRILEIGSGKATHGVYSKSYISYFDQTNTFVQSDVNPEYGHRIVDITNIEFENEFDLIVCSSVLEHVFDLNSAIAGIYKATKPLGIAAIIVPSVYPLHDEPHDYWRMTEHSLRRLLCRFSEVKIENSGMRKLPFMYAAIATK